MTRSTFSLGVLALVLTYAPARADLIPWQYQWSNSPLVITADTGPGTITLTDEPLRTVVGDSDIVATNLRTHSTAPPTAPDVYTNKPYTLGLYLRDSNSGDDTTLTFAGLLNGTVAAQSANVDNTFTGTTTYSVVLGGNSYTVAITSYTPPGPPDVLNPGAIGAQAEVTVIDLTQVPEPGTLVLAGLAVASIAATRLRRAYRRPTADAS